jgi:F-type H+-transporting ATPase subunit gamma
MAKARALDKRRKSVRNIRKITRTMELISTAKFKKAMDRAQAATAYTAQITQIVKDLARSGLKVSHPLLEKHDETKRAAVLVLTANRGLCGGYNGAVIRTAIPLFEQLRQQYGQLTIDVSGKRGLSAFKFRGVEVDAKYTQFEDQPRFSDVEMIANRFLDEYASRTLDRLDVVYTRFVSVSRQEAVVETLLPLSSLTGISESGEESGASSGSEYDLLPSAESILQEVVPASFRVKLFKCFLDAAVGEQIARMVAMKAATENAGDMIKQLSMTYNRARQSQITGEIMEIIGGAEALNK